MVGVSVEDMDGLRSQIPLPMSTLKKTTKLSFVDDTVHLKDNLIMDHSTAGACTMLHCDGNKSPTSTKQPFFKGIASRSLFRSAPPLVTTTKPTSSNGVLSLSKQVGLQIPKVQSDGVSSDADVPLSKLFIHNPKVHDASASQPKPPTEATKKRKLPCVHSPLRHLGTPLMQSKLGRNSKAFDHRQTNKKSSKNSHPILKMIRKGPVELK